MQKDGHRGAEGIGAMMVMTFSTWGLSFLENVSD